MENLKRQRRTKSESAELHKQILALLSLDNTVSGLAKSLKIKRQLVGYYANKKVVHIK